VRTTCGAALALALLAAAPPAKAPPHAAQPAPRASLPVLSVLGFSQAEGDSGTTPGTFTISLSAPSTRAVTVRYATKDGTAIADAPGRPGDYQPVSGMLTLPPHTTSATVDVPIRGDRVVEPDEVFYLVLSQPQGARLGVAQATGEILDDDGPTGPGSGPALTIDDAQVNEGDSGRTPVQVIVSLSTASAKPVTVDYATADGSATAGVDYDAVSGRLQFPAGTTHRVITVPVRGDTEQEGDEDFVVQLSNPVGATLARETARVEILDDDGPGNALLDIVGSPERHARPGQVVALQVRLRGAAGGGVRGASIEWRVDGAGTLLDGDVTATDRNGIATQRLRIDQAPGRVVVRATEPDAGENVVFQVAVSTGPGGAAPPS
jgi:hypothetical protein